MKISYSLGEGVLVINIVASVMRSNLKVFFLLRVCMLFHTLKSFALNKILVAFATDFTPIFFSRVNCRSSRLSVVLPHHPDTRQISLFTS